MSVDGEVVKTLPELQAAAEVAKPLFDKILLDLLQSLDMDPNTYLPTPTVPLKKMDRVLQKAEDDYSKRQPGPSFSWVYDVVRSSIYCDDEDQITAVLSALRILEENRIVRILRLKNRFRKPTPAGFRDINMNIGVMGGTGGMMHICELQVRSILRRKKCFIVYLLVSFCTCYAKNSSP